MTLLHGKVALVTGIANDRSIGYGVATQLRKNGARLALTYQNDGLTRRLAPLASALGAELCIPCDLTNSEQLKTLVATLHDKFGGVDCAVHSIAYANKEALRGGYLDGLNAATFEESMNVSVFTFTSLAKAISPIMPTDGGGSLITMSFLGSEAAIPHYNVMGVAKAALESSVRYIALTLGATHAIRANAISAGGIKTIASTGIKGFRRILEIGERYSPLRRNVSIEEVGDSAVFLASDLSRAITGEVLHVDCGLHSVIPGFDVAPLVGTSGGYEK